MRLSRSGVRLCLALALLAASGCRESRPPKIEICLGDGVGGADCVQRDGARKYRPPSELKNYWMTNPEDQAAFAAWCYDTSIQNAKEGMDAKEGEIR